MSQRESQTLIWPDEPVYCPHAEATQSRLVCPHLVGQDAEKRYLRWFSGEEDASYLICTACAMQIAQGQTAIELCQICWLCHQELETQGKQEGLAGLPAVIHCSTPAPLQLTQYRCPWPLTEHLLDLQPLVQERKSVWVALTTSRKLVQVDLTSRLVQTLMYIPPSKLDMTKEVACQLSPDGQMAALVNPQGRYGIVVDLRMKKIVMHLERDIHEIAYARFPLAFFQDGERLLLVHGTAWNRLNISDPRTGELLTTRTGEQEISETSEPDHCSCHILVSPDQQWIASNSWTWHPAGVVSTWHLQDWLHTNPWEPEQGASLRHLCRRSFFWNEPLCWIDGHTLAVWGHGEDEHQLSPAVRLFDVRSGQEVSRLAGPERGALFFEQYLYSLSTRHGLTAWNVQTGECVFADSSFRPTYYHPGAHQFLQFGTQQANVVLGTLA
jgi:hypothetical protein